MRDMSPSPCSFRYPFHCNMDLLHGHTLRDVKLTLVWTDPPASVFSSSVMVNDIDLDVEHDGEVFYPNKW